MGTIAQKLQKAQQSKDAIKAALIAKGVKNVDDVMSHYAGFIEAIQSGGGGDLDFTKIGYDATPQYLIDGLAYAEEVQKNPSLINREDKISFAPNIKEISADRRNYGDFMYLSVLPVLDFSKRDATTFMFNGCASLKYFVGINCDKITNAGKMFAQCYTIESVKFDSTKSIWNFGGTFDSCWCLREVIGMDATSATGLNDTFSQCKHLECIPSLNSAMCTNFNNTFNNCGSLKKISLLDFSKVESMNGIFVGCNKLCFLLIKNLGKSSLTNYDLSRVENWGDDSKGAEGARQSLIDTLITYSFDKNTAEMPVATIKLHPSVKARLTESEIAQITAKGYTLA